MLGRLFFRIHWILFIAFVGTQGIFLLSIIIAGGTDTPFRPFEAYKEMFDGDTGLKGILFSGAMTWIPIVFLFIDYVINGKWTWFPWQRNKE